MSGCRRAGVVLLAILCALSAASALSGCTPQPLPLPPAAPGPPALSLRPVEATSLPGWDHDAVAALLPAMLRQCRRLALLPPDAALGGSGLARAAGGKAGDWTPFCRAIQWVHAGDDDATRRVITAWLQAYEVSDQGQPAARFTGYFEPEYPGALGRDSLHGVPVYRRPPDLLSIHPRLPSGAYATGEMLSGRIADGRMVPYWTRAEIDRGALAGKGLEIAYLSDPADLYFLQVQGSGRIRLPSGQIVRLGYAGRNGAPYVPLGRVLVDQHQLAPDGVSMQSIRTWLAGHPSQSRGVMEQNPNYVFFRPVDDLRPDQGPIGALGVDLQPERSLAIDRSFLPLAAPLWIDTTDPQGAPLQRLTLAQDLGTDIKGPTRADIFFGWGAQAAHQAGLMHQGGRLAVLLPRPPAAPPVATAAPAAAAEAPAPVPQAAD